MRPHLATLVADFRRHGRELAVVTHRGNRRLPSTYTQLAELSARCAHAYAQHGLRPGDRILIWGNNSIEWIAAFFGCAMRGIVAVPLDAAGSLEFAQRVVNDVQPRLLVGDLTLLRQLTPGIPRLDFATLPPPDYASWPGLTHDTPLQIVFTSGTTAEPKGIVHTHGNVLASLDPLEKEISKYLRYERLVHPLRILHTLPLSHVFGQFMGLWVPALLAAELHFEDRLQAPRLVRLLHRERISVLAAVPRVLDLLRTWLLTEFPTLPASLTAAQGEKISHRWWRFRALHRRLGFKFWAFVCGGATLPRDLEAFWTTAGFALIQGYGMTETTALVTLNHPFKTARGSIGKPLAGREVQLADDGEILVRGPSIVAQIWRQGRLETQPSGWLATGDLAARNQAGDLVFAGRKSDLIVTAAGLNLHPQDVEAVIRCQAGVTDCLVVADDSEASPIAVLISEAEDSRLREIIDQANQELASFQQIHRWLRWPQTEFPRTSSGKVLRRSVQSWARQALSAEGAAESPTDPVMDLLHQLGTGSGGRLSLDSLGMVQLQSALETRFGVEIADTAWQNVTTVSDVQALVQHPGLPRSQAVFPRWPGWRIVRLLRGGFVEAIVRPLVWLFLAPRVSRPSILPRPSLLIANHLTVLDVPLILYALRGMDRRNVAVAMSGNMLTGWREGRAQRYRLLSPLTPLAYALVSALFNVFPLPRGAGLRQSFAHAGEALNRGQHVLVFPEGRRSADGRRQPFEPGTGLLAQESQVPVQPILLTGVGSQWPGRGKVTVHIGPALEMGPGEDPQSFTQRLEAAMAQLETQCRGI